MTIVLAFLLGMPLVAVPQISERLFARVARLPDSTVAKVPAPDSPVAEDHQLGHRAATSNIHEAERLGSTVTMLASDREVADALPNPKNLTTTIESLKAQFMDAGVTYMLLERIGSDSVKYRFQFDVPVAGGSAYRKRFQVIDEAPDVAMRTALLELQQWRLSAREPDHLKRPTVLLR